LFVHWIMSYKIFTCVLPYLRSRFTAAGLLPLQRCEVPAAYVCIQLTLLAQLYAVDNDTSAWLRSSISRSDTVQHSPCAKLCCTWPCPFWPLCPPCIMLLACLHRITMLVFHGGGCGVDNGVCSGELILPLCTAIYPYSLQRAPSQCTCPCLNTCQTMVWLYLFYMRGDLPWFGYIFMCVQRVRVPAAGSTSAPALFCLCNTAWHHRSYLVALREPGGGCWKWAYLALVTVSGCISAPQSITPCALRW
jgi:hypothetical protein